MTKKHVLLGAGLAVVLVSAILLQGNGGGPGDRTRDSGEPGPRPGPAAEDTTRPGPDQADPADRSLVELRQQDAHAVAVSASAPTLTLAGHLEARFTEMSTRGLWTGDPERIPRSKAAALLISDRLYNPEGKVPTVEQERALQEMIDSFDERSRPLHAMERRATIEALIRAAAAGSFESVDVGPQPTTGLSRIPVMPPRQATNWSSG